MIDLSLKAINDNSPYQLLKTQNGSFSFHTDYGKLYEVGFVKDEMIMTDKVYQFFISEVDHTHQPKDAKVGVTITHILEEFFKEPDLVLDYICDSSDHRQAARFRIFKRWFDSFDRKDAMSFDELSAEVEGEVYYAAVIYRKDNPNRKLIEDSISKFKERIDSKLR